MNTTPQQGVHLCFYCHVRSKHDGMLLSEWLLKQARDQRLGGGSVFRAIAGFGRHGVLHEEQFFELADNLPVRVEFLLQESDAQLLLDIVRAAGVDAICTRSAVTFERLTAH